MHICASIYTHINVFLFICTWICGVGMYEHICAWVGTCVNICIPTHGWASEYMCACTYPCMLVCTYMDVHMKVWITDGGISVRYCLKKWRRVVLNFSSPKKLHFWPQEATFLNTLSRGKHLWWILGTECELSMYNHGPLCCFKAILNSKKKKRPVFISCPVRCTLLHFAFEAVAWSRLVRRCPVGCRRPPVRKKCSRFPGGRKFPVSLGRRVTSTAGRWRNKVSMFPSWLQMRLTLQRFTFPRRTSTQETALCSVLVNGPSTWSVSWTKVQLQTVPPPTQAQAPHGPHYLIMFTAVVI